MLTKIMHSLKLLPMQPISRSLDPESTQPKSNPSFHILYFFAGGFRKVASRNGAEDQRAHCQLSLPRRSRSLRRRRRRQQRFSRKRWRQPRSPIESSGRNGGGRNVCHQELLRPPRPRGRRRLRHDRRCRPRSSPHRQLGEFSQRRGDNRDRDTGNKFNRKQISLEF